MSYCKVPPGKGCGFVHFVERRCAERAMGEMNGQLIGSSAVRISWGRNQAKFQGGTMGGACWLGMCCTGLSSAEL